MDTDQTPILPDAKNFSDLFPLMSRSKENPINGRVRTEMENQFNGRKKKVTQVIGSHIAGDQSKGRYDYFTVSVADQLFDAVCDHMLLVDGDMVNFKFVHRGDGTTAIYAHYNSILGSCLIANVDTSTVPTVEDDHASYYDKRKAA